MKKIIRDHSHTPAISKTAYQVGVQMKTIDYGGQSATWAQDHVIVYPNGSVARIKKDIYFKLYGGEAMKNFPAPRRREAVEHTRRKLGL